MVKIFRQKCGVKIWIWSEEKKTILGQIFRRFLRNSEQAVQENSKKGFLETSRVFLQVITVLISETGMNEKAISSIFHIFLYSLRKKKYLK